MKIQKVFPIKTETACQLKWSHSTVFLTKLSTASCHRVNLNKFDLETFDFHNTPEKIKARQMMLAGQWPGEGCEHCKHIEDAGGTSDRMLHLDFHGITAPPELDSDLSAVKVTPRMLEIYFSNTCNLKCVYCQAQFSSQINSEQRKFGPFEKNGIKIPGAEAIPEEFSEATDKLFNWLDSNIHSLHKLLILGGEPFIQKETHRLLDFLKGRQLPDLDLVIFSNLTIEHDKFKQYIDTLKQLELEVGLNQIQIVGSLDCWGEAAEYVRSGLDLDLFVKNFEYVLHNTRFVLSINSALGPLTIPTMPELVRHINKWNETRTVYWSLMKTASSGHFHPTIFGKDLLPGFEQAIDEFKDFGDPEKSNYKEYFKGIALEIEQSSPNIKQQQRLKTYLTELDRRRNTDYTKTFPYIAELLRDVVI